MPKWMLKLKGHEWDIETLGRFLPEGHRIEKHKDRHHLVLKDTSLTDYALAKAEAHHVLNLSNAFARTQDGGYILVEQGGWAQLGDDGQMSVYLEPRPGVAVSRGRATLISGEVNSSDVSDNGVWFEVAHRDRLVMSALNYWAAPRHNWDSLYRTYEVVEKAARVDKIDNWMGRCQRKRFQKTANYYRHGVPNPVRDCEPMDEREAFEFVRQLLRKWLADRMSRN
jgi:hypothetical protein